MASHNLVLLVFENVNLSQLDSLLLPFMQRYAAFHSELRSGASPVSYSTPLGMFPANLLLAGVLIDSPLALPMSRELWTCSAFVDANSKRACSKAKLTEPLKPEECFALAYGEWLEWLRAIEYEDTSDTCLMAAHVTRDVESSSLFKRMLRRLARALDQTGSGLSEAKRAGLLTEMTMPFLLSRGISPDAFLDSAPADVSIEDGYVDNITKLFERWGLESR